MFKRILKWTAGTVLVLGVVAFGAFLYFIPPFFVAPPETFSQPVADAAPGVDDIQDPATRLLAERGRYLVVSGACIGCHQTPTPQGPDLTRYLAGGMRFHTREGTFVTRNLTPDAETGIGRRTDEELKRVLRSGVMADGRVVSYRLMPWGAVTNWTEEDRHAVVVYLRHLDPVSHRIPEPVLSNGVTVPGAIEQAYGGRDYGIN
jgi:hypothetical protein